MLYVTFEEHKAAIDRVAGLEEKLDAMREALGRLLKSCKVSRDFDLVISGNMVARHLYTALQVATRTDVAHAPPDAAEPRDPY